MKAIVYFLYEMILSDLLKQMSVTCINFKEALVGNMGNAMIILSTVCVIVHSHENRQTAGCIPARKRQEYNFDINVFQTFSFRHPSKMN